MQRVGILVDGTQLSPQFLQIVSWLQARGKEPILIVQHKPAVASPPLLRRSLNLFRLNKLRSLAQRLLWNLFERIEKRDAGDSCEVFAGVECPAGVRVIDTHPNVSPSGLVLRHSDADLAQLRDLDLALILRGGANILRGEILSVARHGILSLHHGDNRANRGGPAAFWEVYLRWPATGYIVQRLTDALDGGEVLRRGSRPTHSRYLSNLISIEQASTDDFIEVMALVLDGKPPEPEQIIPYGGPIFRAPTASQVMIMLGRIVVAKVEWLFNRVLAREKHWRVGVLKADWRTLSTRLAVELPPLEGHFLADPFVVERDGQSVVFVEQFGYREAKGAIAAYRLNDKGGAERLGAVLEEPFHLSFPFMVEDDGQLFMIPESEQAGEVRLYRCVDFPMKWKLDTVLLTNFRALDSMVFKRDGQWWMLVGQSKLHALGVRPLLYRAPELRGPWSLCACSPISGEIDHARNGGLLRHGQDLYRVVQLPEFNRYGVSIAIHRIDRVSDEEFVTSRTTELRPGHRREIAGGHHLHHSDEWTVFDYWGSLSMRQWPWQRRR